jgi:hypothetical protein
MACPTLSSSMSVTSESRSPKHQARHPIVAVVDTNHSPIGIARDSGNDDSSRAIRLCVARPMRFWRARAS